MSLTLVRVVWIKKRNSAMLFWAVVELFFFLFLFFYSSNSPFMKKNNQIRSDQIVREGEKNPHNLQSVTPETFNSQQTWLVIGNLTFPWIAFHFTCWTISVRNVRHHCEYHTHPLNLIVISLNLNSFDISCLWVESCPAGWDKLGDDNTGQWWSCIQCVTVTD